ncbi:hypothetical protein N7535_004539 [Penicillium sp. DV-2018c]|nr:hypothetical protein N7461_008119 [Penicillium sp. DV-2018c]KAJ5570879.1 hypothetical protein N7535_004539 [Penicillium sp. DV-2018c]
MAPITKTLALAGAFFAMTGYSAPVAKRAVVWETVTNVVWKTVDVTTTVYPHQATTTAVPVVAPVSTTVAAAPTVEASTKEIKKVEPTISSTSSTVAPAPTAPAPAVQPQAQAYSAPEPVVQAQTTTAAPAPVVPQATARAAAPEPAPAPQSSSGGGACTESAPCDGEITFYDTATTASNPSSCGLTNDGTVENVLALPVGIMQDGDCGKTVTIEYNGQTATGTVVDKCMGCDNTSIDLSRHLFGELADMGKGRVSGAKWYIH